MEQQKSERPCSLELMGMNLESIMGSVACMWHNDVFSWCSEQKRLLLEKQIMQVQLEEEMNRRIMEEDTKKRVDRENQREKENFNGNVVKDEDDGFTTVT